jgi:hypothetical protein
MKSNPLFIDSTKFHGDLISTQFELRRILVYEGETIFVVISRDQGDSRRFPMKLMDDGSYSARMHLNHQTLITYRFEIEIEGKVIFSSASYRARVQYAIVNDWEPSQESSKELPVENENPASLETTSEPAGSRIQVASIRSMMDQFGL